MRLFFDENLSYRLVEILESTFPGSTHVRIENMRGIPDTNLWEFCIKNDYVIVSNDTDFYEKSILKGYPPKVIWLNVGNAGTNEICELLIQEYHRIEYFIGDNEVSLLILPIL